MDLLKKLLWIALITFPLGVLIRIKLGEGIFMYPVDAVLSLSFVYTVYLVQLKKIRLHPIHIAFFYFVLAAVVSLLFNSIWLGFDRTITASLYLLRFILFIHLTVALTVVDKKFLKTYLRGVFFAGFIVVIVGYLQYFLYPDLRNLVYLGWDDHLYRMFSTFLDPNFAGALFVMQFLISIYILMLTSHKWMRVFAVTSAVLSLGAVFLTYSRTAYFMLLFSMPFYLILLRRFKLLAIFVVLAVLGIFAVPKDLRSEGVDLFRTQSIVARFVSYSRSIEIIRENPVLGVGFNAYRYAQEKKGYLGDSKYEVHSAAGVANSYLFTAATTGVVGFIIFLNLIKTIVSSVWIKMKNRKHQQTASLILASTSALLIGSLFENIFFYSSMMFWYFILLGVFIKLSSD